MCSLKKAWVGYVWVIGTNLSVLLLPTVPWIDTEDNTEEFYIPNRYHPLVRCSQAPWNASPSLLNKRAWNEQQQTVLQMFIFGLHSFFCVWDNYLPCTVFDLIPGSAEAVEKLRKFISAKVGFSLLEEMQPAATFFPNSGQLKVWWKPELYWLAWIPQSRSGIMCQAGNEKLQHFRGEARARTLHGSLLQCKSAPYLSLSKAAM